MLLVDDEPLFLDVFSFHVERHGGRVRRATSADAALQILEQDQVDLVVTDYDMPHLDGAMLRRKIRRRARTAAMPVVMLTGMPVGPEMPRPYFLKTQDLGEVVVKLFELIGAEEQEIGPEQVLAAAASAPRRAASGRRQRLLSRAKHRAYAIVKRGVDIAVITLALTVLAPMFAMVALAILVEDPGPILFRQTRVGRGGRLFKMLKFRSMKVNPEALHASLQSDDGNDVRKKLKRDPRVTRVGRFIRRFSIDELPQLWNVLIGDMTLVGPRPPIPAEVALYGVHEWRRLDVTPGLTCIWQVSGRADVPFPEQVLMDQEYVLNRSLKGDLELLAKTLPAVVSGKGAY